MTDIISVGDYVRFCRYRGAGLQLSDTGLVASIDDLGVLTIEPKNFKQESWNSPVNTYRRYTRDIIKMTKDEIMLFLLEK